MSAARVAGKNRTGLGAAVQPGIVLWLSLQDVPPAFLRMVLYERGLSLWAQRGTPSNKLHPSDADTPVIKGLFPGLLTVITPCVLIGNMHFQGHFHSFITAIARFITAIRLLLQQ